jgi:outer membrane protein assembly factor BamB
MREDKVPVAVGDNGLIGVGKGECVGILDLKGRVLEKICNQFDMEDASYSNGIFGFLSENNYVYLFKGAKFWKKMEISPGYGDHIAVLSDGLIACHRWCMYITFEGRKKWSADIEPITGSIASGLAVSDDYIFVSTVSGRLLIFDRKDGSFLREIQYGEEAQSVAVCENYLAVGTRTHLYLYRITDPELPEEICKVGGFFYAWDIAFMPRCGFVAVADGYHSSVKIIDLDGTLRWRLTFNESVLFADMGENVLAVETKERVFIHITIPV